MALTFDFALEGFRTLRERPKLLLFWGAALLFGNGLGILVLVAFSGPYLPSVSALKTGMIDNATATTIVREALPGFAAWLPIYLLTLAVLGGAICRAGLREGDDRFGFLQFGLSEIRILVVLVAKLLLAVVIFFAVLLVAGAGAEATPAAAVNLQSAGLVVAAGLIAWLEIRLSLNVPQSFATRRVDVFGSFALTRGRFWILVWGYLAASGLSVCVAILCFKIIGAVVGLAFGEKALKIMPDTTSLRAYLTPQTIIVQCLFNGLTMPQLLAILFGPSVAAYRALASEGTREQA